MPRSVQHNTDLVEEKFHLPGCLALHMQGTGHPDTHVAGLDGIGLGPVRPIILWHLPFAIIALLYSLVSNFDESTQGVFGVGTNG